MKQPHDVASGLVDRGDLHRETLGDLGRGNPLDRLESERLPGRPRHPGGDQRHGLVQKLVVKLLLKPALQVVAGLDPFEVVEVGFARTARSGSLPEVAPGVTRQGLEVGPEATPVVIPKLG